MGRRSFSRQTCDDQEMMRVCHSDLGMYPVAPHANAPSVSGLPWITTAVQVARSGLSGRCQRDRRGSNVRHLVRLRLERMTPEVVPRARRPGHQGNRERCCVLALAIRCRTLLPSPNGDGCSPSPSPRPFGAVQRVISSNPQSSNRSWRSAAIRRSLPNCLPSFRFIPSVRIVLRNSNSSASAGAPGTGGC